jgi:hypothetical protein
MKYGFNPYKFKKGDMITSIYSGRVYEVVEPDKKGMAKLKELETGFITDWNSCNNPHFELMKPQLELF